MCCLLEATRRPLGPSVLQTSPIAVLQATLDRCGELKQGCRRAHLRARILRKRSGALHVPLKERQQICCHRNQPLQGDSPMPSTLRPSKTVATLSAALLLGAGGGAGAALAIDGGNTTTNTTRVVPGQTMAAAATTSDATTVNDVYRQSKQGVVDITVKSGAGTA